MERLAHRICRNRSWPAPTLFVVLATILCLAVPVIAQELPPPIGVPPSLQPSVDEIPSLPTDQDLAFVIVDPALAELVAKLDDSRFGAREQAMQRLLSGPVDRDQICKMLVGNDLSPEQRHRLLVLLRNDLLNAPRGAIGIMIDRRKLPDNIIIEQLIEDLPAIEVLQPGDRITHLDGKPAPDWPRFRKSIESRKPGDIISITIERWPPNAPDNAPDDAEDVRVQILNFELSLGSADLLRDPATGQVQPSQVQNTRAADAYRAAVRFGPRPRLIEFRPQSTAEAESESLPTQHGS